MAELKTNFHGTWVDRITCKQFVESVTDYFENKLTAVDRTSFEAHLAECSGCPTHLEQMRTTIASLGKLTNGLPELHPKARKELLAVYRKWKAHS